MYISGGTITVNCTATAAKGIKCDGDMNISGGSSVSLSSYSGGNSGGGGGGPGGR